jgi:hypothetical protein
MQIIEFKGVDAFVPAIKLDRVNTANSGIEVATKLGITACTLI